MQSTQRHDARTIQSGQHCFAIAQGMNRRENSWLANFQRAEISAHVVCDCDLPGAGYEYESVALLEIRGTCNRSV
jgi:hypothetical protein